MREQNLIRHDLKEIINHNLNICIFGCGYIGQEIGYDILNLLEIKVQCYCDNDSNFWGKKIKENLECISPKELFQRQNMACLVMVGERFQEEIVKQLKDGGIDYVITFDEISLLNEVIDYFLQKCTDSRGVTDGNEEILTKAEISEKNMVVSNPERKKCAVYTCITGNYDQITEPQFISDECDYYFISEHRPKSSKIFKWIDLEKVVPDYVKGSLMGNRFCKINGYQIFSEYQYSIYIDGNIQIVGDTQAYIEKIGKSGIAAYRHPMRKCIYEEALVVYCMFKDKRILQQTGEYYKQGMPRNYGLFGCGILARDNSSQICKKIMTDWWKEVFCSFYRDQISFPYCLWKNGFKAEDVGMLGESYKKSSVVRITSLHRHARSGHTGG